MPDTPRHPAKKNRDAKRVGRPPATSGSDAQDGRAWVRPTKRATGGEPSPGESQADDGQVESPDDAHLTSRPPTKRPSNASFRMRLGAAADEEAQAHQQDEARRRLQRLRPWISALFLAAVLSLLLYLASLVVRAAGTSETADAIIFLALLSGGLVVWGLSVGCTLRLREWPWLAGVSLTPFVAVLGAALIPLPLVVLYPLLPIVALVYAWSKRGELFA